MIPRLGPTAAASRTVRGPQRAAPVAPVAARKTKTRGVVDVAVSRPSKGGRANATPTPAPAPALASAPSAAPLAPPSSTPSYGWQTDAQAQAEAVRKADADPLVRPVPLKAVRRPLAGSRTNDPEKVAALAASIEAVGLLEPIDVLEVDGIVYGFSGCHRFEAHVRLGRETILCRVRRATRGTLEMHLR